MNNNEIVLKYLKELKKSSCDLSLIKAINIALPALEKQIPVKVECKDSFYNDNTHEVARIGRCPKCWHPCAEEDYCPKCGQKLDWGEE